MGLGRNNIDPPIKVDCEIMSGTPCFTGTRVPVKTLFDHLAHDYSISEMLEAVSDRYTRADCGRAEVSNGATAQ
jgi:hypothetical protein